jgi:hypothetical protein
MNVEAESIEAGVEQASAARLRHSAMRRRARSSSAVPIALRIVCASPLTSDDAEIDAQDAVNTLRPIE